MWLCMYLLGRELELLTRAMALPSAWSVMRVVIPFVSVLGLLGVRLVGASQDSGSVIPAESRPCVDCHAFEFMQRALQDLKKMAYNLDTRDLLQKEEGTACGSVQRGSKKRKQEAADGERERHSGQKHLPVTRA
uniref:NELL2-interacting cell ontogeny regulator 1 n=1 Tax=Gallus gallus TaxID=9031 RepID=A0A8V0YQU6_CHICK